MRLPGTCYVKRLACNVKPGFVAAAILLSSDINGKVDMLSSYDLKSVVDMIERSSVSDYPYMKAHAHMDLAIIRNQCRDRTMTNKEESAAEFAIEIIIQL